MAEVLRRVIGVVAERQVVDNPWVDHRWRVTAVLPSAPAIPPWTLLKESAGSRLYYAGDAELALFPRETDTLKYNIEGLAPAVYVFLRHAGSAPGMALAGATVCPGEAHAHADTGSDQVEPVPMPDPIRDWVAAFVADHHVERAVWKRKREGVTENRHGRPGDGKRVPHE